MKASKKICDAAVTIGGYSDRYVRFNDIPVGSWVDHGHKSGNGSTVFASRIYGAVKIECEATSRKALRNKIVSAYHQYAKINDLSFELLCHSLTNNDKG